MNYNVRKSSYFIEITPKDSGEDRIRELIRKRKASRWLDCSECEKPIPKGTLYIRDKFWYKTYNSYIDDDTVKTKVNFICLDCWRGEIPPNQSTNWIKRNK